jgi:hypothetical protein
MEYKVDIIGLPPFQQYVHTIEDGAYWDGNEVLMCYHQTIVNNGSSVWITPIETSQALPPVVYKNGITQEVYTEYYVEITNTKQTPYSVLVDEVLNINSVLAQKIGYDPGIFEPKISDWNSKVTNNMTLGNYTQFNLNANWSFGNNSIPNAGFQVTGREVHLVGDVKGNINSIPIIVQIPSEIEPRDGSNRIFICPMCDNFNPSSNVPPTNKGTILVSLYKWNNMWFLAIENNNYSISYYAQCGYPSIVLNQISWVI